MKAEELRLGNWIKAPTEVHNNIEFQVYSITTDKDGYNHFYDHCTPISITEEWLLKFGFEKEGEGFRHEYWYINDFEIQIHGDKFPLRIWGGESAPHLTQYIGHKTKYIHQLQNLYFALTGEELTIKD